ncbi:SDR family NAD(P)-dependent oxidoreductase [Actinoallomurus sp. NBC_01490]|uniref:SDR family NAD(P)-dependent oxidoreductase n=1 Tax=Actinoallomurus sp. NBC_01490 TaxID=2903557 RepID=UPI002E369257|nr:SDR family NAD(P)-dependent oxidoreductase [Actinoallomurus sp. NBC_01490]
MSPPRTALVTGSTNGIGAAVASALAADGVRVLVTDRNDQRGAAVAAGIERGGDQASFLASELDQPPGELREFAGAAAEAFGGRVDILVHSAALCPPVGTPALSDDDLEATPAVNGRATC